MMLSIVSSATAICICLWKKYLLKSFAHFLFVFLLWFLSCRVIHICRILDSYQIYVCQKMMNNILRNSIMLAHATMQRTIENMLSENIACCRCVISFIWNVYNRQIHTDWSTLVVARACREGEEWRELLVGTGFLFGMMTIFWNSVVLMVAQPCEYTQNH